MGLPATYEQGFYIDGATLKNNPAATKMTFTGNPTITGNSILTGSVTVNGATTCNGDLIMEAGVLAANGGNAVTLAANGGNGVNALNPDANALAQAGWVTIGANRVIPYWNLVG